MFSGGTSLFMAWGLIKRFSEDIDFKVAMPGGMISCLQRRRYGDLVLGTLVHAGFTLLGAPVANNESRFFSAELSYPSAFHTPPGLRAHVRLEVTFQAPALPVIERPVRSLLAQAANTAAEASAVSCLDPLETAADKLSALAWRVCCRDRRSQEDDPTLVRHLHDLAALHERIVGGRAFGSLMRDAMAADADRGGEAVPPSAEDRLARMLARLTTESLWRSEYEDFVRNVSFALPEEGITFDAALAALRHIVADSVRVDGTPS